MNLPFVVEPQAVETVPIGNEQIGILNIPKLKDLAPVERRFLKQQNLIDIRLEGVKVASTIAAETGQRLTELYTALFNNDLNLLSEHLENLIAFQNLTEEAAERRTLALATAILRFRIARDQDWTLENTMDTDLIHPELVREIALFAQKEESGWVEAEAATPTEPPTDEDLGNS